MSSFKRYSHDHYYIVTTFFSLWPYACSSAKYLNVANIGYVGKKKLVGDTFKITILTPPVNVKRNYIQFLQKGKFFENILSGRYLFFFTPFLKNNEYALSSKILSNGQKHLKYLLRCSNFGFS